MLSSLWLDMATITTNTRLEQLEDRNTKIDQKAHDDRVITLKEVYERVIAIEVKYDLKVREDRTNTKRFVWFVYALVLLSVFDIAFSLLAIYIHTHMGG